MNKIKIITDSTLDLPKEIIKDKDIEVLPLLINFGEDSYLDGIDINTKEMLDRIERENTLPTTAQITPLRFEEAFRKHLDNGDKVIAILLSSEMSGTYQSACIAKNMIESDDVIVIDSRNVTVGLGLLALKACDLRDKGATIKEIEEAIIESIPKVKSSLNFVSLENLVKGGRLSKTAGAIGSVLGLRLILEVKDGHMAVKDKLRGNKKAIKKVISDFENGNADLDQPVVLLEILSEEVYTALKEYLEEKNIKYIDAKVGCTVAIHSGVGACGLFFFEK